MTYIALILSIGAILFTFSLHKKLKAEERRNRILQSFIAGIVRSISDYRSLTDNVAPEDMPQTNNKLPIPYKNIVESIQYEFWKDFGIKTYEEWLKYDRNIFSNDNYGNDGFNFLYYDFYDDLYQKYHSPKNDILSDKDKQYLENPELVTEENIWEIKWEIAIFKDLLAGKLDDSNFTEKNIDSKIQTIFSHLKQKFRDELRKEILKRRKK